MRSGKSCCKDQTRYLPAFLSGDGDPAAGLAGDRPCRRLRTYNSFQCATLSHGGECYERYAKTALLSSSSAGPAAGLVPVLLFTLFFGSCGWAE